MQEVVGLLPGIFAFDRPLHPATGLLPRAPGIAAVPTRMRRPSPRIRPETNRRRHITSDEGDESVPDSAAADGLATAYQLQRGLCTLQKASIR